MITHGKGLLAADPQPLVTVLAAYLIAMAVWEFGSTVYLLSLAEGGDAAPADADEGGLWADLISLGSLAVSLLPPGWIALRALLR